MEEDQALLQLLLSSLQILKLLIFPEFSADGSKVEVSISVAKLSALAQQSPVQTQHCLSAPRGHGGPTCTNRHTMCALQGVQQTLPAQGPGLTNLKTRLEGGILPITLANFQREPGQATAVPFSSTAEQLPFGPEGLPGCKRCRKTTEGWKENVTQGLERGR